MSTSYDEALVQQFNQMLLLEFGNDKAGIESLLDPIVIHRGVSGDIDHHDRLGNVVALDIASRHGDVVPLNPEHSKRAARLVWSDAPVFLDTADQVKSLINAVNGYREMMLRSLKVRVLKHVLDGALGTALTGIGGSGSQALPSSQKIAIGASPNDVLTETKIKGASAKLDAFGVPPGSQNRLFFYSPGQTQAIMGITHAISSDFTRAMIMDRGTIDGVDWYGFRWVMVPDVKNEGAGGITTLQRILPLSSTTRGCIAMGRAAVGLSIGKEIKSEIDVIPMKRHATLVRPEMVQGAVRTWDGAVVQVDALEQ